MKQFSPAFEMDTRFNAFSVLQSFFHCGLMLLLLLSYTLQAAKVPDGASLSITLTFKNNNNLLRNKTSPTYAIPKDGYASTIWIEGPYDPQTPCRITSYERQGIKLARIITFFAKGRTRDQLSVVPNPWNYMDYRTPDFAAALIKAGMHYHCSYFANEHEECTSPLLSQVNSRRQNLTTGGTFCDSSSVFSRPFSTWCANVADVTEIPDGISSATVYPDSAVTHSWNLKDRLGNYIDEGYYLVYIQMSAERAPRDMDGDIIVNGKAVVNMETCWDDPYYDTLGHHRVVNLFHFKDSAFSKVDTRERKWQGDSFNYLKSGIQFAYAFPQNYRPLVTLSSFNGGGSYAAGSTCPILWQASDNTGISAKVLYYSLDHSNWVRIDSSASSAGPQQYNWQMPAQSAPICWVRVDVLDAAGHRSSDESDGPFQIIKKPYFTSPDSVVALLGQSFSYKAKFTNPDPLQQPVFGFAGVPSWLTVIADSLYGTAPQVARVDSFRATVYTGSFGDTMMVKIYVRAPIWIAYNPSADKAQGPLLSISKDASGQKIYFNFSLLRPQKVGMTLHDVRGRLLWKSLPIMMEAGYHRAEVRLNPESFPGAGLYILNIETLGERKTLCFALLR